MSLVPLPPSLGSFLQPYLPPGQRDSTDAGDGATTAAARPFVTLTYAQSLDSRIAAAPGTQTKISHLETKTMTHYIRSRHDAILVGIGTVLADDPKLNCRYQENGRACSPRPVVFDPHGKWDYPSSQLRRICDQGDGLAPYIVVDEHTRVSAELLSVLTEQQDGRIVRIALTTPDGCAAKPPAQVWALLLAELHALSVRSVMVEGGARIINDLLVCPHLVDSLIVTIGPVFLGSGGVEVSPPSQAQLRDVKWWTGVQDSVLCAKLPR